MVRGANNLLFPSFKAGYSIAEFVHVSYVCTLGCWPISGSVNVLWFPCLKFAFTLMSANALLTLTVAYILKSKVAQCSVCLIYTYINLSVMDYFLFCYFQVPDLLLRDCEREIKKVNSSLFLLPLLTSSNRNIQCKVCINSFI